MKKILLVLMLLVISSSMVNAGKIELIKKAGESVVKAVGKWINDNPIKTTVVPMVAPSAIEAAEDLYDEYMDDEDWGDYIGSTDDIGLTYVGSYSINK